jgi:predicted house-cleaning noncanonical NTP pyrophosphatase (MazG superfamily)
MKKTDTYNFSFTAASLRIFNFMRLVDAVGVTNETVTMSEIDEEKILAKGNAGSSNREMYELLKRYNALTPAMKQLLVVEGSAERKQIAFVGLCKTNALIRDFVVEILREKALVFDYKLEDSDFITFLNRKQELHPELEKFAESTKRRAKQQVYKILEEVGLIDSVADKNIQQQWLDSKVAKAIIQDNPEYLKFFLQGDKDIQLQIEL